MDAPKRRLILHFDLNKTIIVSDATGNKNMEACLCDIICENAWGRIETQEKDGNTTKIWIIASDQLSIDPPAESLVTYKSFLELVFPKKKKSEEPNETARQAYNNEQKKKIIEKEVLFPKPGNPGVKFKKYYEKMLAKLELPKHVKDQLGLSSATEANNANKVEEEQKKQLPTINDPIIEEASNLKDPNEISINAILKSGNYNLIPSFFGMMRGLKKAKREFAIVFRTFGSDLHSTISEFNSFCTGKHPCFNGVAPSPLVKFDGSKGNKSYVINECKGMMYRFDKMEDTAFVTKTLEKADNKEELDDYYSGALEEGRVEIIRGSQDIYVHLLESLQNNCTYAIQDEYAYWASKDEAAIGGKLFWVDDADYETHQIFFDDNISEDPNHSIVDCRDLITGETIPYKKVINKYIVRVETDKAILENDYYLKKIEECEKRRNEEIELMEKGLTAEKEPEAVEKPDEWNLLMKMKSSEYLMKTVLPVVYQGLREIDIIRPNDPIRALAFYMLKNKNLVKLPEPKVENVVAAAPEEIKKEEIKKEEIKKEEIKKEEERKLEPKQEEQKKKEEKKKESKKEEKKIEAKKETKKK